LRTSGRSDAAKQEVDPEITKRHETPKEREPSLLQFRQLCVAIHDRHALYSTKEFKKVGVRYFTDAEVEWEKAHA
jgi:hypothetical protein